MYRTSLAVAACTEWATQAISNFTPFNILSYRLDYLLDAPLDVLRLRCLLAQLQYLGAQLHGCNRKRNWSYMRELLLVFFLVHD